MYWLNMCHWKFKSLLVDILFHEKVNHPVQAPPFENESYGSAMRTGDEDGPSHTVYEHLASTLHVGIPEAGTCMNC